MVNDDILRKIPSKNDSVEDYLSQDRMSEEAIQEGGAARMKSPEKIIQGCYIEGSNIPEEAFLVQVKKDENDPKVLTAGDDPDEIIAEVFTK